MSGSGDQWPFEGEPRCLGAVSRGRRFRDLLSRRRRYRVHSVFARALNLWDGGEFLTFLPLSRGRSETCATLALARGESLLDFEVKTGFETRVYEGTRVQVGAGLVVDFSSSEEWESRLCHLRPRMPDGTSLTALYRVLLDSRKESPFRGVIDGTDPRLTQLLESLRRAVLEKDEAGLGAALERVVGLGPGLTPSGDDLITGLSLTRSVFREVRLRQGKGDALWGVVVRRALTRTHELSAFFVEEALSGRGHEFAEDTLAFLLEGRPRETALAASRLIGLGATSGFDIGVGLYLAAEWERRYAWCSGGC